MTDSGHRLNYNKHLSPLGFRRKWEETAIKIVFGKEQFQDRLLRDIILGGLICDELEFKRIKNRNGGFSGNWTLLIYRLDRT